MEFRNDTPHKLKFYLVERDQNKVDYDEDYCYLIVDESPEETLDDLNTTNHNNYDSDNPWTAKEIKVEDYKKGDCLAVSNKGS